MRIHWRWAVLSTAIVAVVFAVLALPVGGPGRRGSFALQFSTQLITWTLWLALAPAVLVCTRVAHALRVTTWRGALLHVGAGLTMAFVHSVLFAFLRWKLLVPTQDVRAVVAATVGFVYGSDLLKYILIASLFHALMFHRDAQERLLSEARLSTMLAQARLEVLEARLHPHFLFNTLNAISALIRKDPQSAITMVDHLGDLLRAALRTEPGKMVTLSAEFDLLRQYLAIQQARFSDRLSVTLTATADALATSVPQLILQPLVENAIEHGIAPREANGQVDIDASLVGDVLRIVIRDDGVGFGNGRRPNRERSGNGIGINNTKARLQELYGDEFRFDIAERAPHGTLVTLHLPTNSRHDALGALAKTGAAL